MSDRPVMGLLMCCASTFASLSRAAAKSASSRLRRLGFGGVHPRWAARAAVCERCPMRTFHRGISYCGRPLLHDIMRDPAAEGCGCPTVAKAKAPDEHCPLDARNHPAAAGGSKVCNCRWCAVGGATG